MKFNHKNLFALLAFSMFTNLNINASQNNTKETAQDSIKSNENTLLNSFKNANSYPVFQDDDMELLGKLRNMPNIEVGKGITFMPADKRYKMTMRFRMQNMVGLYFDDDFGLDKTEAQVKRRILSNSPSKRTGR